MSNFATVRSTEPRARRKRANHDRILKAALDIVVSEGFDRLTLHRVAAATDYTRAALYRYFASKEALISALTVRVIDEIRLRVIERLETMGSASPLERIVAAVGEFHDFVSANPAKFGMLSMLMAESRALLDDESSSQAVAALERALSPLSTLLEAAETAGALTAGDADARAAVLFASVHGALQLRKQTRLSAKVASTETLCSMAVTTLLLGWGAAPDSIASIEQLAQPTERQS